MLPYYVGVNLMENMNKLIKGEKLSIRCFCLLCKYSYNKMICRYMKVNIKLRKEAVELFLTLQTDPLTFSELLNHRKG